MTYSDAKKSINYEWKIVHFFLQTTVFIGWTSKKVLVNKCFDVIHTRFSLSLEMTRLTRDGTTKPVSRDQILRREHGQENIHFRVQLTTSWIGNLTRLIHNLDICVTIHTYIYLIIVNID